ncbi:MAG: DEAD/DEAH box helicase family protein [Deltaproteobacteria bacterium]
MTAIQVQYNNFILKNDTDGLKLFLDALPSKDKGAIFESLLTELYRGNGWLVQKQGGRGDAGADILLYHPKTPSTVSLIIQAKNHSLPLTFDQTRIELIKFEEQSAPLHNCQNFRLVAVNGYVREAHKLGAFNLLLDGWEHVEKLVKSYDPESTAEPSIELFAHNRITYQRINELWEDSRHVAVVQATGTGKSYLIAKVLADFLNKRKVVLAPSTYILEQQKGKIPWIQAQSMDRYAKKKKRKNVTRSKRSIRGFAGVELEHKKIRTKTAMTSEELPQLIIEVQPA